MALLAGWLSDRDLAVTILYGKNLHFFFVQLRAQTLIWNTKKRQKALVFIIMLNMFFDSFLEITWSGFSYPPFYGFLPYLSTPLFPISPLLTAMSCFVLWSTEVNSVVCVIMCLVLSVGAWWAHSCGNSCSSHPQPMFYIKPLPNPWLANPMLCLVQVQWR